MSVHAFTTKQRPPNEPDPWGYIAANATFNLVLAVPAILAHAYQRRTATTYHARVLHVLAIYGEHWVTAGVLINLFRDFLWAFLSSSQVGRDPYYPLVNSLEDNARICLATAGFGGVVVVYQRLRDGGWGAWWGTCKATVGAALGLMAWNVPAWISLGMHASSTFPESYAVAPLMGVCEGLAQLLCTAFPTACLGPVLREWVLNYVLVGWEAGTAWQLSAVVQGLYVKSGYAPAVVGSVNLAATVGAFNAASSALCACHVPELVYARTRLWLARKDHYGEGSKGENSPLLINTDAPVV
jgi:hypothetical protein